MWLIAKPPISGLTAKPPSSPSREEIRLGFLNPFTNPLAFFATWRFMFSYTNALGMFAGWPAYLAVVSAGMTATSVLTPGAESFTRTQL